MRSRTLFIACAAIASVAFAAPPANRSQDREALRRTMEAVIEKTNLKTSRITVQVRSIDDGSIVFSKDPDELLNPASNVKLFTAAAALAKLGPEYRYETDFLVDQEFKEGKAKVLYIRG